MTTFRHRPLRVFAVLTTVSLTSLSAVDSSTATPPLSPKSTPAQAFGWGNATPWTQQDISITSHDGVALDAHVFTPDAAKHPHPIPIIIPASFATDSRNQFPICKWLAEHGYLTVTYASRGFDGTGGVVDADGPNTVADVSSAIDWVDQNTTADLSKGVGAHGLSYAAATVMLAAARDSRIRAIDAYETYADYEDSVSINDTRTDFSRTAIYLTSRSSNRYDPEIEKLRQYFEADNVAAGRYYTDVRSPVKHVDQINANKTAVQMRHAYQDSILPPLETLKMYQQLTVEKRWYSVVGDHGQVDVAAELFGQVGAHWRPILEWFDHHLKGIENGATTQDRVHVNVSNNANRNLTASTWEKLANQRVTYYAHEPQWFFNGSFWPTAKLTTTKASNTWNTHIFGGQFTFSQAGLPYLSSAPMQFARLPHQTYTMGANRFAVSVMQTDATPKLRTVAGTPRVSMDLTTTGNDVTVVAYLFEVNPFGVASLMSHKPYSVRPMTPGVSRRVNFELDPIVWDVAPGNSLALVVSTSDLRYLTRTGFGEKVTITSTPDHPVTLEVPFAHN